MVGLLATGVQGSNVMSRPGLLPRVRSLSKALKQPRRPVLKSVAPIATDGYVETCGQGCHLGSLLVSEGHAAAGAMPI